MAQEAASLTDMRNTAIPAAVLHRTAVVAPDSGLPTADLFCVNHGRWARARIYATPTFVNGSNPSLLLHVWTKKHVPADEVTEPLGRLMVPDAATASLVAFAVTAGGPVAFDVTANGDDLFVEVISASGAPDSYAFDCYVSWRP
jgi:hypothetical protein